MAKLLKITEMAETAGVKPSTIRYYTDQGLLKPAKLTPGSHKLYDEKETIARLRKIRGISEKPSLQEAKEILENGKKRHLLRKRMLFLYGSILLLLILSAAYLNLKKENVSFFSNDWRNIYTIEEVKLAQADWRTLETRELDREYLERLEGDSKVRIKRGMSQALAAESPKINYLECANQKEAKRLLDILEERCKEHTYLRKGNVVIEIISEHPSLREEVAQRLSK
ncbi:MerR family transcriptional regulator [bacterium]|nr:MerR family transcriptional regulator [bacterium]